MKTICIAVNNNIFFDQRMIKIGNTLQNIGYNIIIVGRRNKYFNKSQSFNFKTYHLPMLTRQGKIFYVEFHIKLFFKLLFIRTDAICSVDLDTAIPCFIISKLRGKILAMDAHELFTELHEVISRPSIHKIWLRIEKSMMPRFKKGYTVNTFLKNEFNKRYNIDFQIIRNLPLKQSFTQNPKENFILCQGAVNQGRGWDILVQAVKQINTYCVVAGDGNYFNQLTELIEYHNAKNNFKLTGMLHPSELIELTKRAKVGVTLFEANGLNQYQSLSNRFFDYMMAGTPQVCVGYPEYVKILMQFPFAVTIQDLTVAELIQALNKVLNDDVKYEELRNECEKASEVLNWENESQKLIEFWKQLLPLYIE